MALAEWMPAKSRVRKSAAGKRAEGFTLLEVVVTFSIVGLLIALVWVAYPARTSGARLRSLTFELEAFLRQARTSAEQSGRSVIVRMDGAHLTAGLRNLELPGDVDLAVERQTCDRGDSGITFRADGTSCTFVLQLGTIGDRVRVAIDGQTGHVHVKE